MAVTIYHNPKCGTSRKVLAMIEAAGGAPRVVEYLKAPPTRAELVELLGQMKARARDVLRDKGDLYEALGLDDPNLSEDQLIDAITAHPILMNRPIVTTPKGTRLCRPADLVHELL